MITYTNIRIDSEPDTANAMPIILYPAQSTNKPPKLELSAIPSNPAPPPAVPQRPFSPNIAATPYIYGIIKYRRVVISRSEAVYSNVVDDVVNTKTAGICIIAAPRIGLIRPTFVLKKEATTPPEMPTSVAAAKI